MANNPLLRLILEQLEDVSEEEQGKGGPKVTVALFIDDKYYIIITYLHYCYITFILLHLLLLLPY